MGLGFRVGVRVGVRDGVRDGVRVGVGANLRGGPNAHPNEGAAERLLAALRKRAVFRGADVLDLEARVGVAWLEMG